MHILPIAVVDDSEKEVSQLESDRAKLLMGMRAGARRVLELFLPAMQQSGADDDDSGYNSPEQHQHQQVYLDTCCTIDDLLDMMLPLSILNRQVSHHDYKGTVTVQSGILIE